MGKITSVHNRLKNRQKNGEIDLKVIITAPRGKMGKLIAKAAFYRQGIEIVAGIAPPG
ncbi:hypothetical protein SpAn4DRAFT_2290 [Sporomusa ovata]|uniref:Uncharacterized protein n=1 Tax=Sporomusa ovata TaxID=2378 RepID=A0A0U1L057_9FIRM|nr:hypothetical protein [Sporomusa ovata]CQR73058.1 hypothetical protein SpAn4DRAFT_2290 [Sporomusa ovata]